MNEAVKINRLEIENVKRVKAVSFVPSETGLTVIGGRNGQGKTSVLDAIAWALGGEKYCPSEPAREGSVLPPMLKVTLSNGLIVERKGKNSALKVSDPSGRTGGQQLLNQFVEELALDLPKFYSANDKEKADTLLKIIGVGDELYKLEQEEKRLYNERYAVGRIADTKAKHASEIPYYEDAPGELISIKELIDKQQAILAQNGENMRKRQNAAALREKRSKLETEIAELTKQLESVIAELKFAELSAAELEDISTKEIEESIANIETINSRVRSNMDHEKAQAEAEEYRKQYEDYNIKIDTVRNERMALLNGAKWPLEGLSVEDGKLKYKGFSWDNMSSAEQLKVSTAIVRELNPKCGFVLMDKLEVIGNIHDNPELLEASI